MAPPEAPAQPRDYPFEPFLGELPGELLDMVHGRPVSRVRLPDGRPAWLVVGYREVCTVLADPRFTRQASAADPDGRSGAGGAGGAGSARRRNGPTGPAGCPRELSMNGPAHTSLRRLASRAFTARRIETYRPRVQAVADDLVDAMLAAGPPVDLMGAFVSPTPVLVICEVLGVPAADRDRFNAWAAAMFDVTAHGSPAAAAAAAELRAYLHERLAAKRREPGGDLLSAWLAAAAAGELTDEEIVGLAVGVLLGGREINSIAAGVRALFRHPRAAETLRADPRLLAPAVEEILRFTTVSSMFLVQTAVADVDLAGHRIRAGDAVMAVPWAANHDRAVFPEAWRFDIGRAPNPHLSFGYGPHFCLGAALGRLEMEVAVGTLLRRLPTLAPAVPLEEIPWRNERVNCGMAAFPVTW